MNYLKKLKLKRYPETKGISIKYWLSRIKYGFDIRETWALYDVIDKLLYERLCAYREVTEGVINLEFHKIEHKGELITLKAAIDLIINRLERKITDYNITMQDVEEMEEVYVLYSKIRTYLWW